jgi:ubiquitin C-terminal hydrolase
MTCMDKITGLINMGNTCFLNVALQVLMNCPGLVRMMIEGDFGEGDLAKYQRTFRDYFRDNTRTLGPLILYKRYQKLNRCYSGFTQEDAHEYLTFVLDDMHELSKASGADLHVHIRRMFEVGFESRLTCMECGHASATLTHEKMLSLAVGEHAKLEACLHAFCAPEMLPEADAWHCDKCARKVTSRKEMRLVELPEVLLIGLKRVAFSDGGAVKRTTDVDFPSEWDIGRRYRLRAIVYHLGSFLGGHYMCAVTRDGQEWKLVDDTHVVGATAEQLQQLRPHAYLLMYAANT